jgi:hypothetical protein
MNYVLPLRIVQIFLAFLGTFFQLRTAFFAVDSGIADSNFLVLALCAAAIAKYDGSVPSLSFLLFTVNAF